MKITNSSTSDHLENTPPTGPTKDLPEHEVLPTNLPQDPRNWPRWKKDAQILMVAFHSMMGTFMAAGIIPAYTAFAEDYKVTIPTASYFTAAQVCGARSRCILPTQLTDSPLA